MLIAMQRPDATRVAGYRTWQGLGRQVCKGEHGITIFAPCPWKRETDDGESESGIFFRAVHVFDVAQTDGQELPDVDVPAVDTAADDLLAKLRDVAGKRGIAVNFSALSGGLFGVSKGGTVDVDDSHATGQQAKTLAHELAHEALHKTDRTGLTRSVAELEAESVAYVVCTHAGLDVEVRASRYIALWDGDSKALRASLERIANTARQLIDDVEAVSGRKAVA
jgi:antirestriction protein ArdC